MGFELVHGVYVADTGDVHSAYSVDENGIYATFSADVFEDAVSDLVAELCEPVFLFVETPCNADEEKQLRKSKNAPYHYNVYYLDNCTAPVAKAIMKRYGELLVNDGVSRFGFGSHENGEEIYCRNYQTVSVYGDSAKYSKVMDKLGISCEKDMLTLWDVLSDDNGGTCSTVEINGETVNDIVTNLESEGMYLADRVAEIET